MNQFSNNSSKIYDLEERTFIFGKCIINLCHNLQQFFLIKSILSQLIRSGTSIGANYAEANSASSKRDFRNKIYLCKKEAHETRYWLKLLLHHQNKKDEVNKLYRESHELCLIFQKITNTLERKGKLVNCKIEN